MQEYYIFGHLEDIMRTETEEIRDNLKYLSLLARYLHKPSMEN